MVSARRLWAPVVALALGSCSLFGDYTTARPSDGGGGQATGGAGGATTSSTTTTSSESSSSSSSTGAGGMGPDCPPGPCPGTCGSTEDCWTVGAETTEGNVACGEVTNLSKLVVVDDEQAHKTSALDAHFQSSAELFWVGTKGPAPRTAFLHRIVDGGSFPEAERSLGGAPSAEILGTGVVMPVNTMVPAYVLGMRKGMPTGFPDDSTNLTAFAFPVSVPIADPGSFQTAAPLAPPNARSRFLAGTLTSTDGLHNEELTVVAAHTSSWSNMTEGQPRLSVLRLAPPAPPKIAVINGTDCAQPGPWQDVGRPYPAEGAAGVGESKAFFAVTWCNRAHLFVQSNPTLSINPIVLQPAQISIAALHLAQVSPLRVIVVGTFAGELTIGTEHVVASGSGNDAFIAVFDEDFQILSLQSFGGTGDMQVNAVDFVFDQVKNKWAVHIGGWLSGDANWTCFGGDFATDAKKAFFAKVALGDGATDNPASGTMEPLILQVYGQTGDSEITGVRRHLGLIWLTALIRGQGSLDVSPTDTSPDGSLLEGGPAGKIIAFPIETEAAFTN